MQGSLQQASMCGLSPVTINFAGSAHVDILGGEEEGLLGEHGAPHCHARAHHILVPCQVSWLGLAKSHTTLLFPVHANTTCL